MTFRGTIRDGAVELDAPVSLPDGTRIICEVKLATEAESAGVAPGASPYESLLKLAGTVTGWPQDASENLDHYLYGHPKK